MATWITSTTEYDAVRAAISVSLTAATLPDAIIALPIYTGVAEMAVKALDPDWATRTGDDDDALQMAAIFWCASLLVYALPRMKREAIMGEYSYENDIASLSDLIAHLRGLAQSLIAQVAEGSADIMPTFFTTAPGRRMRSSGYTYPTPAESVILGLPS